MSFFNTDRLKRNMDILMIGFTQLSLMFSALSVAYIKIIALTIYVLTVEQKYEFSYIYLREPLILVIGMISGFRMFANILYISKNTISWVYRIADTIIKVFYFFMFAISTLIPVMLVAIIITPLVYDVASLEKMLLAFTSYITGAIGIPGAVDFDLAIWLYLFFIFFTIVMHFPKNADDAIKMQSFSVIRKLIYVMFYPILKIADSVNNSLNKEGIMLFRTQFLHFLQMIPDNIALAINDIILVKEFVDKDEPDKTKE